MVVDLDRDGFDDVYFTSYEGPALFFRNTGDGTFEEISEELGLRIDKITLPSSPTSTTTGTATF